MCTFRVGRWLHAHDLYEGRLRLPVVLGVPDALDARVHGQPLVWIIRSRSRRIGSSSAAAAISFCSFSRPWKGTRERKTKDAVERVFCK